MTHCSVFNVSITSHCVVRIGKTWLTVLYGVKNQSIVTLWEIDHTSACDFFPPMCQTYHLYSHPHTVLCTRYRDTTITQEKSRSPRVQTSVESFLHRRSLYIYLWIDITWIKEKDGKVAWNGPYFRRVRV